MTPENTTDAPRPEPADAATAPARRVVVAEDETLIRLDIVEILRGEGFDVVGEADKGERALELARDLRPDLVLMDVKMPVMDGITAAETIAKERIAPVVLLTAFSQKELVERAREAGAMAYVVKPFGPNDLIPAMTQLAVSLEKKAAEILPSGYHVDYAGQSRQLRQEAGKFLPALGLAPQLPRQPPCR